MDEVDEILNKLKTLRTQARMPENESRHMFPERETRPRMETEPRDWQNRLQSRNTERAQDWSGSSWAGQSFGGRNWSGGRER